MHLWTHVTDVFLDLPDALARASPMSEKLDIAGIGLWIVGTDKAEQGAFARAVRSAQSPSFALMNGPVEGLKYCAVAIPDAYVPESQYFSAILGIKVTFRKVSNRLVCNPVLDFVAQFWLRDGCILLPILRECHLRKQAQTLYRKDMRNEVGNVVALA